MPNVAICHPGESTLAEVHDAAHDGRSLAQGTRRALLERIGSENRWRFCTTVP
jgi:hypothetical protein